MQVMEPNLRRDAVDRAYRDHAADVYRVAYAIVRDAEAAMEATQDAFARAFERWEQYDANRPLRPWLHGIAAHVALDALRRSRVRDLLHGARVTEIAVHDRHANSDPSVGLVRRELIEEALGALKPLVRAALVLRHHYGYDYDQIATLLRTSSGNVGSMLSRGHAQLRTRLAESHPEPEVGQTNPRRASR
jgi:RNA polymerase sigma-70 factor (ECF subfamily)